MKSDQLSIFLVLFMFLLTFGTAAFAFQTFAPLHIAAFIVCCFVTAISIILTILSAKKNKQDDER